MEAVTDTKRTILQFDGANSPNNKPNKKKGGITFGAAPYTYRLDDIVLKWIPHLQQ